MHTEQSITSLCPFWIYLSNFFGWPLVLYERDEKKNLSLSTFSALCTIVFISIGSYFSCLNLKSPKCFSLASFTEMFQLFDHFGCPFSVLLSSFAISFLRRINVCYLVGFLKKISRKGLRKSWQIWISESHLLCAGIQYRRNLWIFSYLNDIMNVSSFWAFKCNKCYSAQFCVW